MNNNHNHHEKKGGHFFNGFLWGAILGGGFAYLVSTKRGRDLLKDLAQDGLDMLDDLTAEPEMAEQELSPLSDEVIAEEPLETFVEHKVVEEKAAHKAPTPQPKKRFFRAQKKA